jgi:hypothetical protein
MGVGAKTVQIFNDDCKVVCFRRSIKQVSDASEGEKTHLRHMEAWPLTC